MTEEEWKKKLTPEQFHILRQKGTEMAFSGQYNDFNSPGIFHCAACNNPIFDSSHKFSSCCGWPSFDQAIPEHVKFIPDNSHGMQRMEVVCAQCGSHLGHIFTDGPSTTGERFCINSLAMNFHPKD